MAKRLVFEDSIPIALDSVYVSERSFPSFLDDLSEDMSLYGLLSENYGIQLGEMCIRDRVMRDAQER